MYAMSAAHPTLPLPSYARVTNLDNRKASWCGSTTGGRFLHDRIIDLSYRGGSQASDLLRARAAAA